MVEEVAAGPTKSQEIDEEKKYSTEDVRGQLKEEGEAKHLKIQDEANVRAEEEEEAKRLQAEERLAAEIESARLQMKAEEEAKRLRLAEERLKVEEESKIRAEEEEEAIRLQAEETARLAAEKETARLQMKAEEEAKRLQLEEEAKIQEISRLAAEEAEALIQLGKQSEFVDRRRELEAQAAEEIRAANEVKRNELNRLAREREEIMKKANREGEQSKDQTESDLINLEGTIPYADPFSNQPHNINPKPLTLPDENQVPYQVTEDDKNLSDIQIMQSIALAEQAALRGQVDFKTTDHIGELDSVQMLFVTDATQGLSWRPRISKQLFDRICRESKKKAIVLASRIKDVSRRAGIAVRGITKRSVASYIGRVSKKTKYGVSMIKGFPAVVEQRRREQVMLNQVAC